MPTIKYKKRKYRYSKDFSWNKWVKILTENDNGKINDWYYKHVLIDKPFGYKAVKDIVTALRHKFEHTQKQRTNIMRDSAKVVRGINTHLYQRKIIIFNLMYELHMSYDTITKMDWHDVLFFHGMISEVKRLEKEANDRNNRKR